MKIREINEDENIRLKAYGVFNFFFEVNTSFSPPTAIPTCSGTIEKGQRLAGPHEIYFGHCMNNASNASILLMTSSMRVAYNV